MREPRSQPIRITPGYVVLFIVLSLCPIVSCKWPHWNFEHAKQHLLETQKRQQIGQDYQFMTHSQLRWSFALHKVCWLIKSKGQPQLIDFNIYQQIRLFMLLKLILTTSHAALMLHFWFIPQPDQMKTTGTTHWIITSLVIKELSHLWEIENIAVHISFFPNWDRS